jgi:HSP20 family protein
MEFFKIRFGNDLDELTSKFEKTLEDMLGTMGPSFMLSERTWRPPMDMYETREEVVILAEIGGVDKEDLEVEISSKALRVQGRRLAPSCSQVLAAPTGWRKSNTAVSNAFFFCRARSTLKR